jgi:hypothetical protein
MEYDDDDIDDECSGLVATEPAVANPAENASEGVPTEQTARTGHAPPPPTIVSEEAIRVMTVPALKDELGRRGLSKSGVKAVLIERLTAAINSPSAVAPATAPAPRNPTIAVVEWSRDLEAYNPNAHWKVLQPNATPRIEPERPQTLRGSTVPENEREFNKFDFHETWDRPPFTAMSKVVKIGS